MSQTKVQINELRLRVPGLTRTEARRLGELVAKHLSDLSLAPHQSRRIPEMSIRLRPEEGDSPEPLARAMAAKIRSSIGNE